MRGYFGKSWPVLIALACAAQQSPAMRDAIAAINRGDFPAAEQQVRAELRAHPGDALALSLLGVALDAQKRFEDAETAHRQAVAADPRSPDVWNNFGNHLSARGDEDGAQAAYRKAIGLNPSHFNANIQLARLALKHSDAPGALTILSRLPADRPPVPVLRLEALYRAGQAGDAEALASRLSGPARTDLALAFSAGLALSNAGQFEKAESFFEAALAVSPSDFNVLFNLGVVAGRAGQPVRARDALNAALRQQPRNIDVLYQLALTENALHHGESALQLLAEAAKIDPRRPEVQKAIAFTTADLNALDDSAAAWDRYLALVPGDEAARRERAYLDVEMGRSERGLPELQRFASRHPDDPLGQYQLAMAYTKDDPARAIQHLDKVLNLNPRFAAARAVRGALYYQMGKPEAALPDLEAAAAGRPNDAETLDRLGQTYGALDRPADAVRVLERAASLAPDDSKVQLHYARALADAGRAEESKAVMERFRRLGPAVPKNVPAGLVDYLSLTPEQRRADYRARVEKAVHDRPEDVRAQHAWLKLLLEDGSQQDAAEVARRIDASNPKGLPSTVEADVALAEFQALAAAGKPDEASAAIDRALRAAPDRPDLYRRASAFLVASGKPADALRRVQLGLQTMPQNRDLQLVNAVVLQAAGREDDAASAIAKVVGQWPEWRPAWVAQGRWLATRGDLPAAREAFRKAEALGARGKYDASSPIGCAALLAKPPEEW